MISGSTNVVEWFKMQNKPFFSILRKGKEDSGNVAFTNKNSEGENMITATNYLEKCLSLLETGDFLIYCSETPNNSGKGRSEIIFTIRLNDTVAHKATDHIAGVTGGYTYEDVMRKAGEIATDKFEQLMAKKELETVRKELDEAKKENKQLEQKLRDPWNKVVDTVAPHIGSIIESFGYKPPVLAGAISGHPHDETISDNSPLTAEQQQQVTLKVQAFCEALSNKYPDTWVSIIEKLTAAIQTTPDKIDMALKFL